SPDDIARSLGVRYQVEGSVLRTDDRVRVSAQLVNSEGQVLWSARFDEAIADLFALQDKITTQISGVLATRVALIEQRRALAKPTDNLEAYEYVLRARPTLQHPGRAEVVEARALFRRAIALDPNFSAVSMFPISNTGRQRRRWSARSRSIRTMLMAWPDAATSSCGLDRPTPQLRL